MAHSAEIITDFYCTASFHAVAHRHNQIRCSGPQCITKFAAVAHSALANLPQWPIAHNKICCGGPQRGRTLEIKFLGELEFIFETALDHESGDQLGTFGEITLDKKISCYCPFKKGFIDILSVMLTTESFDPWVKDFFLFDKQYR